MGIPLLSTVSHLLRWEGTQYLVFSTQFWSQPRKKWHDANRNGIVDTMESSSLLPYASKEGYEILQWQWMYLPCNTSVYFQECYKGIQNLVFCMHFESQCHLKLHDMNYKGLANAIWSSSHLHCELEAGYKTPHQQQMSLLAVLYLISCTERVPKI